MNVKLLRISTGEEVVAEIVEETADSITIKNGLVVLPNAQNVGFAPWATVVDRQEPEITMSKQFLVYAATLDPSVKNKYCEMFGGITTPSEKDYSEMKSYEDISSLSWWKVSCLHQDGYVLPYLREYNEYREPFLGGGSVAIHVTKCILT